MLKSTGELETVITIIYANQRQMRRHDALHKYMDVVASYAGEVCVWCSYMRVCMVYVCVPACVHGDWLGTCVFCWTVLLGTDERTQLSEWSDLNEFVCYQQIDQKAGFVCYRRLWQTQPLHVCRRCEQGSQPLSAVFVNRTVCLCLP